MPAMGLPLPVEESDEDELDERGQEHGQGAVVQGGAETCTPGTTVTMTMSMSLTTTMTMKVNVKVKAM